MIPIGDSLGRVLAEIIRHVKRFYNSDSVPGCDHWNLQEKRPRPPAPYFLHDIRHPCTAGIETIRRRIREISIVAEAKRSDGSPRVLLPHDCRRVFASEYVNNNNPVHIIQALLCHASPDRRERCMAPWIELFLIHVVDVLFVVGLGGCAIVVILSWISILKSAFSDDEEDDGQSTHLPTSRPH